MALYGNLDSVSMDRFYDLGKSNGGFFITSYVEKESNENNLQRCIDLREKICKKGLAYIPVFCGNQGEQIVNKGKCCFYVINRKKNSNSDDALISSEVLFKFAHDLCNEFGQQYFIFLDKGEIKSISKTGRAVGLFSPNVMFSNLVSSVFPFSPVASDDDHFVRTFETLSGQSAHGMAGELFLRKEELPASKVNWIKAS